MEIHDILYDLLTNKNVSNDELFNFACDYYRDIYDGQVSDIVVCGIAYDSCADVCSEVGVCFNVNY